jgi:hypothetical protein
LWSGGQFPGPLVLGSSGYGVDLALDYLVKAEDAQPFILEVLSTETGGRYLLNVTTGNPIGRLTATPDEGTAPFTVRLDASGSFDQAPGTVVSYEFAPLGREEYLPAQASPLLDYEYTVPGEFDYVPTVRVTDNAGNQAICFLTLTVH